MYPTMNWRVEAALEVTSLRLQFSGGVPRWTLSFFPLPPTLAGPQPDNTPDPALRTNTKVQSVCQQPHHGQTRSLGHATRYTLRAPRPTCPKKRQIGLRPGRWPRARKGTGPGHVPCTSLPRAGRRSLDARRLTPPVLATGQPAPRPGGLVAVVGSRQPARHSPEASGRHCARLRPPCPKKAEWAWPGRWLRAPSGCGRSGDASPPRPPYPRGLLKAQSPSVRSVRSVAFRSLPLPSSHQAKPRPSRLLPRPGLTCLAVLTPFGWPLVSQPATRTP